MERIRPVDGYESHVVELAHFLKTITLLLRTIAMEAFNSTYVDVSVSDHSNRESFHQQRGIKRKIDEDTTGTTQIRSNYVSSCCCCFHCSCCSTCRTRYIYSCALCRYNCSCAADAYAAMYAAAYAAAYAASVAAEADISTIQPQPRQPAWHP
jgi:hypothetical protein